MRLRSWMNPATHGSCLCRVHNHPGRSRAGPSWHTRLRAGPACDFPTSFLSLTLSACSLRWTRLTEHTHTPTRVHPQPRPKTRSRNCSFKDKHGQAHALLLPIDHVENRNQSRKNSPWNSPAPKQSDNNPKRLICSATSLTLKRLPPKTCSTMALTFPWRTRKFTYVLAFFESPHRSVNRCARGAAAAAEADARVGIGTREAIRSRWQFTKGWDRGGDGGAWA